MTDAEEKGASSSGEAPTGGTLKRLSRNSGLRYLITGGLAFLLDFGLLALFHEVLGWEVWLATGLAFVITFAFNFTAQKLFTFSSTTQTSSSLIRFTILVAFNTGATVAIVTLMSLTPVGWALGKIVATFVTTVWNYFIYRYWVFAAPRTANEQTEAKSV